MNILSQNLPIIESCEGCGACCRVVALPPFRRLFNEDGEDAWERLRWERPDLLLGIIEAERALRAVGHPIHGMPCLWHDAATRLCRHHELRPGACREFDIGGQDCRNSRRRAGVD